VPFPQLRLREFPVDLLLGDPRSLLSLLRRPGAQTGRLTGYEAARSRRSFDLCLNIIEA
jgi:hypothetical protein